jgi:hypothetical protein
VIRRPTKSDIPAGPNGIPFLGKNIIFPPRILQDRTPVRFDTPISIPIGVHKPSKTLKFRQFSADRIFKMNDYTKPNVLFFGLAITIALFIGMQMMRTPNAKAGIQRSPAAFHP